MLQQKAESTEEQSAANREMLFYCQIEFRNVKEKLGGAPISTMSSSFLDTNDYHYGYYEHTKPEPYAPLSKLEQILAVAHLMRKSYDESITERPDEYAIDDFQEEAWKQGKFEPLQHPPSDKEQAEDNLDLLNYIISEVIAGYDKGKPVKKATLEKFLYLLKDYRDDREASSDQEMEYANDMELLIDSKADDLAHEYFYRFFFGCHEGEIDKYYSDSVLERLRSREEASQYNKHLSPSVYQELQQRADEILPLLQADPEVRGVKEIRPHPHETEETKELLHDIFIAVRENLTTVEQTPGMSTAEHQEILRRELGEQFDYYKSVSDRCFDEAQDANHVMDTVTQLGKVMGYEINQRNGR